MQIDPLTNEVRLIPYGGDLGVLMRFMQRHGSSVMLNYGEDTEQWECSWIVDGKRRTAVTSDPLEAARQCLRMVFPPQPRPGA